MPEKKKLNATHTGTPKKKKRKKSAKERKIGTQIQEKRTNVNDFACKMASKHVLFRLFRVYSLNFVIKTATKDRRIQIKKNKQKHHVSKSQPKRWKRCIVSPWFNSDVLHYIRHRILPLSVSGRSLTALLKILFILRVEEENSFIRQMLPHFFFFLFAFCCFFFFCFAKQVTVLSGLMASLIGVNLL